MKLTLKKYEQFKAALRPYDYFPQVETLDFMSLGEGDRFYLQDFGIFNSELEEEIFMLRVRVPGGRINAENFKAIADIVRKHNLKIILTARSGMQLHGLDPDNILEVFKQINAMDGLSTWQTFGDNIRNVITDVFDGRGKSCEIEVFPLIKKMQDFFLRNPELVGLLPRRVSTGITGMRENVSLFFSNDIFFGLAQKNNIYGFNVYFGGKNTEIAQSADIFLEPDEVVDFFEAVIFAFNKYGSRKKRMQSRIFHMIESIGMDEFKSKISEFYKKSWQSSGNLLLNKKIFEDFEELADGSYAYRYRTNFGLIEAEEVEKIANFAIKNYLEVRLGTDQQIYLLGLPDKSIPFEQRSIAPTVVACAGSEYCPFSYWSIKEESHYLPQKKLEKYGIKVGISGCMKGCGRHKHADIGIVGLRSNKFGENDKSARIFLGGEYTYGKRATEAVFRSIPVNEMGRVISLVIDTFELSGEKDFETFSSNVLNKFTPQFLEFWFLANLQRKQCRKLIVKDEMSLAKEIGDEKYIEIIKNRGFNAAAESLVKDMWHVTNVKEVYHVNPNERKVR